MLVEEDGRPVTRHEEPVIPHALLDAPPRQPCLPCPTADVLVRPHGRQEGVEPRARGRAGVRRVPVPCAHRVSLASVSPKCVPDRGECQGERAPFPRTTSGRREEVGRMPAFPAALPVPAARVTRTQRVVVTRSRAGRAAGIAPDVMRRAIPAWMGKPAGPPGLPSRALVRFACASAPLCATSRPSLARGAGGGRAPAVG
jgi:hypothetical protein